MSKLGEAVFTGIVVGLCVGGPRIAVELMQQAPKIADAIKPVAEQIARNSDTITTSALRTLDQRAVNKHLTEILRSSEQYLSSYSAYSTTFLTDSVVAFASPNNSEEFSNIFLREGTISDLKQTVGVKDSFQQSFNGEALDLATANDVSRILVEGDENVVIVVAHNDNGAMRFPDGSSLQIEDFARQCEDFGKRCIVLSCDAADHVPASLSGTVGVGQQITFQEAHRISHHMWTRMQDLQSRFLNDPPISLAAEDIAILSKMDMYSLDFYIRQQLALLESATRTMRQVEKSAKFVLLSTSSATVVYAIDAIERDGPTQEEMPQSE